MVYSNSPTWWNKFLSVFIHHVWPYLTGACEWDSNSHIITFECEHYFPCWKQPTEKNTRSLCSMYSNQHPKDTLSLPWPCLRQGSDLRKMFCKLWSHPQISVVVLENKLYIHLKKLNNYKTFRVGRQPGGHWVQPPIFKWAPQMKTRWHIKQITSKLNVSGIWCNVKTRKLLEYKALPNVYKRPSSPCGVHIFMLKVHKGVLLDTSWGTHLFAWPWWMHCKAIIFPHAFKSHLCNSTAQIVFFFFWLIVNRYKA